MKYAVVFDHKETGKRETVYRPTLPEARKVARRIQSTGHTNIVVVGNVRGGPYTYTF